MAAQPVTSVIVWDLETVPDLRAYAAAHALNSEDEAREKIGDKFAKHAFHSIVCIGRLVVHLHKGVWLVDELAAPHVGDSSERDLIEGFVARIAELRPCFVTFNGGSFDLPVLRYRAMVNRVAAPGLSARPYFNRYTEDALDLCDVLSSFAGWDKMKLHELSKALGLPGNTGNIDGADVHRYFLEGKIDEIAGHCMADVVNTYRVWLRYELFRGRLTLRGFEASEEDLEQFLRGALNG